MNATRESTTEAYFSATTDILTIVVLGLTTALILSLNTICLLVLRRVKNIEDTTKVFLRSLMISDLIVGIFPGVPTLVLMITKTWPFGEFLCTIHAFFGHLTHGTSMYSLLLLTVDRYISIRYSLRYPAMVTVRRAQLVVCFTWMSMLALTLLHGFFVGWTYEVVDPVLRCGWSVRHSELYNYTLIGLILLPLVIMLGLYLHIVILAHQHSRHISDQTNAVSAEIAQPYRVNAKSIKTVFIISVSMIIGIVPGAVIMMYVGDSTAKFDPKIFIAYVLLLSNSWINVIIYFLRNKEFRQETGRIFYLYR